MLIAEYRFIFCEKQDVARKSLFKCNAIDSKWLFSYKHDCNEEVSFIVPATSLY